MGYFPNGTAGMDYEARYCERCEHMDADTACPVLVIHFAWNYDAVGKDADVDKREALELFIPRTKDGLGNERCAMFIAASTDRQTLDLFGGDPCRLMEE